MSGLHNHLMQTIHTSLPIWQAPLPFNLIPADTAARISTHGALGIIYIGEHSSKESLADDISIYTWQHEHPSFCFYHPLPAHRHQAESLEPSEIEDIFAQAMLDPSPFAEPEQFEALLSQAIEAKPRLIGFAQGIPERDDIELIKSHQITTFAICHSVAEAVVAEDIGIDIIVLQGNDAGGLHSRFPNHLPAQPQSSMTLLKQAREYIDAPIVLWGDFPTGRDIVAAVICGADSVMIDRPLLSCADHPLNDEQRQQLNKQNETHSIVNNQFSVLPMRHLPGPLNDFLYSDHTQRQVVLTEILRRKPEWRPLCVSPTQCTEHTTLANCLSTYREDIARYLA